MTPAEHLAAAEDALDQVTYQGAVAGGQGAAVVMLWVIAHELAALAAELGVPTTQPSTPVSSSVAGGPPAPTPSG